MKQRNNSTPHPDDLRVKVAEFPEGFHGDVADLLNTPGGADAFGAMIRNARDGVSWRIAHIDDVGGHDLATLQGQVTAAEDLVDVLLHQHPVAREQYVQEVAAKLGCSEGAIKEALEETLRLRQTYYHEHPKERPWRHTDPNGEVGMDIPT